MDEAEITLARLDSAAEMTQNWLDFTAWLLCSSRTGPYNLYIETRLCPLIPSTFLTADSGSRGSLRAR